MNLKRPILLLLIFIVISCKTKNQINPDDYINLVYYKNKTDDRILSHISSQIKNSDDSIGVFIKKHNPRFYYFFSNKVEVDTLEKLYPDTVAIKKTFLKQINKKPFISNFSKLANLKEQEYESFTMDEILVVASRFFDIVDVGNSFGIKICAGGNYFQDLNAIKDVSLIESLTYEAIMSVFNMKKSERPEFISNARINFSDAIKNPDSLSRNKLLIVAKNNLYEMMAKDESLRLFIDDYLMKNSDNLPFEIKKYQ